MVRVGGSVVGLGCVVALMAGAVGCGDGNGRAEDAAPEAGVDTSSLQAVIADGVAPEGPVPGRLAAVVDDDGDLVWEGASGRVDRAAPEPLRAGDAVRIASVTKTFTAAATLRLVEDGVFGLDDPIGPLISTESRDVLGRGGYDVDAITVRHLLAHTSGLPDYASTVGQALYLAAVLAEPAHHWTRLEQIQFGVDHYTPVGDPGEVFMYSDTGYILLGEILERATGQSLGDAYRELLDFESLGLTSTWWEGDAEAPGAVRRAHQEFDSLDADAHHLDPSFDLYGGGGLVATMGDLARFFHALLAGQVFTDPATLDTMLTIPPVSANQDPPYGMGISRYQIDEHLCWGHSGFWGLIALACPDDGFAVAVSVNDAMPGDDIEFLADARRILDLLDA